MTKCRGCGIKLQNIDAAKPGYVKSLDMELCMRCFKLKNYNILINQGISIDNNKIIDKINKEKAFVFFLIDLLNIDNEVINTFKSLKNPKILVLTKVDIIPKNIKINQLITNIKDVYDLKEEIIPCSAKTKLNLNVIRNISAKYSRVIFSGFTNAGKSSLLNTLIDSNITVSSKENTTQDFITVSKDGLVFMDAPGFMSKITRENSFKNIIKPKTYALPSVHYLLIGDYKLNTLEDTNITIYTDSAIVINRRREKEKNACPIAIPCHSDLVIPGFGFIKFSKTSYVALSTDNYEIRPSIIGGHHE